MNLKPELEKIAYLLETSSDELQFLQSLSSIELDSLKQKIESSIYKEKSEVWEKLAKVSKFLPNFINAKIAEDILGANLTANLTYHLQINDALSISTFFSISFLSEVAEVLIPSKVKELIAKFPNSKIILIINLLEKKEKYYTMANFVEYLPLDKLKTLATEINSELTLIKISTFVSKKERLALLIEAFTLERLKKLLVIAKELNLRDLVLEILNYAFEKDKKIVNSIFQDDKVLKKFFLET